MSLLFEYLIKVSLCLGAVYLFYYFLLRPMTWYNWNRRFLALGSVAAFIIPLLSINLLVEPQKMGAVIFIRELALAPVAAAVSNRVNGAGSNWHTWQILLVVFMAGSFIQLARFYVRFLSLEKLKRTAKPVSDGDMTFYQMDGAHPPFSFGSSIFFNRNLYNDYELEKIIQHELVHVKQKHTVDVLLAETLCIITWFNPFAWLLKQAIKQNLEFIADDAVLQQGLNKKGYQYLLLKVSGEGHHRLGNNLLFPSLKKRIQMMNRTKSNRVHLLKFLIVLPLAAFLWFAFGESRTSHTGTAQDAFNLSSLTYVINDERAEAIIKKDQENSLLKPGSTLTLSLISNEKERLTQLLHKNGFTLIENQAVTFLIDSSAANKSFAVQVTINIPNIAKAKAAPATMQAFRNNVNAAIEKTQRTRGQSLLNNKI